MRGKAHKSSGTAFSIRITPAYAGKSMPTPPASMPARDHPRLCGEKISTAAQNSCKVGSPPPMRGKVFQLGDVPAVQKDHPRLCGEKRKLSRLLIFSLGSPPPMRGKVDLISRIVMFSRITPAYAGKSSAFIRSSPVNQDHPRLCGEKRIPHTRGVALRGSPPPMRGKENLDTDKPTRHRITPAYAGKSFHF